jgi:gamma-glutamyltranspeptidase/glutathione hydrolase
MVTSPHVPASEAGIKVLRGGGNAMEAAIAMAAVLSVTYPHFCSTGGDAVLIVADRQGKASTLLGIGQAAERPLAYKGAIPERGVDATLTPAAAVDTWHRGYEFSRTSWGGTMSWASLLDPAIGYAENGFPIPPSTQFFLNYFKTNFGNWPGFEKTFSSRGKIRATRSRAQLEDPRGEWRPGFL